MNNSEAGNILTIDKKIKDNFLQEKELLEEMYIKKKRLKEIINGNINLSLSTRNDIIEEYNQLKTSISDISTLKYYNIYLSETSELIDKYISILNKPIKISFIKKKTEDSAEKNEIINSYLFIAKKYINIKVKDFESETKVSCPECGETNTSNIEIVNNNYICSCGIVQETYYSATSYKDSGSYNIGNKTEHDRRLKMSKIMDRYQGRQLNLVSVEMFDDLLHLFIKNNIIDREDNIVKHIFELIKVYKKEMIDKERDKKQLQERAQTGKKKYVIKNVKKSYTNPVIDYLRHMKMSSKDQSSCDTLYTSNTPYTSYFPFEPTPNPFINITPKIVREYLKTLNYKKNSEDDDVFIYNLLTGAEPYDISHLKENILNDLDKIIEVYYQKYDKESTRKSFLSLYHIFYILLRKYKYKRLSKNDFNLLKIKNTMIYYDDVSSKIFNDLGWEPYEPVYT